MNRSVSRRLETATSKKLNDILEVSELNVIFLHAPYSECM